MLKIDYEYRKGILFVRLIGGLNKSTIKNMELLDNIVIKAGIKYLLINLEKVIIIDDNEINNLIERYKKLIGDDGKLVICGYKKNNSSLKIENYDKVYLSLKEIGAFNIINI